jgi:hypothetical protein
MFSRTASDAIFAKKDSPAFLHRPGLEVSLL